MEENKGIFLVLSRDSSCRIGEGIGPIKELDLLTGYLVVTFGLIKERYFNFHINIIEKEEITTCSLDDQQRNRRSLRLRQDRRNRSGRLRSRRETGFQLGKTGALRLL